MTDKGRLQDEIRLLEFDTGAAIQAARDGKIEQWVHRYLCTGKWANPAFSDGLKLEKRWWYGPVEVPLAALTRVVGPEPGMQYPVTAEYWENHTRRMAETLTTPLALPPLIVEYRRGQLSVCDGNTRHGAMSRLGWPACWVIFWYTAEADYRAHSASLCEGPA
jgi:hypothetical protein